MYVPAAPAPTAPALAPVQLAAAAPATIVDPVSTDIHVRRSRLNVLSGHRASITGALLEDHHAGLAGRMVTLQARTRHGWHAIAHTHTHAGGHFRLFYRARHIGSRLVRLRFAGDGVGKASRRRVGRLNVYRLAGASWYGGGGGTACGEALTSSTLGVANKTLPCGTIVTLRYGDRSIRVPVIDRGPYVAGREFDLTEATKRALGFGDTGDVWSTN